MSGFQIIISIILGYAFGCIQTAYLIGKFVKKIDIRQHGSNNAGASNITTVMGWKYGAITALVDILKAVIPVLIIKLMYPQNSVLAFLCGALVIIGHIFPVNLGFKGGKGAASVIGMFLMLDFKIGLIMVLILVILTVIVDYIALGTIAMFTAAPVLTYLYGYPIKAVIFCVALAVLSYYKHYINLIRIARKEETGLRKVINKHRSV